MMAETRVSRVQGMRVRELTLPPVNSGNGSPSTQSSAGELTLVVQIKELAD